MRVRWLLVMLAVAVLFTVLADAPDITWPSVTHRPVLAAGTHHENENISDSNHVANQQPAKRRKPRLRTRVIAGATALAVTRRAPETLVLPTTRREVASCRYWHSYLEACAA